MSEREDGFTLIELLLVMAITTILVGAVASALITSFTVLGQADDRVTSTRDSQLSSLYFTADVQSARSVLTTNPCPALPGFLVGLELDDGVVVYSVTSDAAGERQLQRRRVVGGPAERCSTSGGVQVLARSLRADASPVLSCTPAPCSAAARRLQLSVPSVDFDFVLTGARRVTS